MPLTSGRGRAAGQVQDAMVRADVRVGCRRLCLRVADMLSSSGKEASLWVAPGSWELPTPLVMRI